MAIPKNANFTNCNQQATRPYTDGGFFSSDRGGAGGLPINATVFATYESNMTTYGTQWGDALLLIDGADMVYPDFVGYDYVYYDGWSGFYKIQEYTGSTEPWQSYANHAKLFYKDTFCAHFNYGVAGFDRFPHGHYRDWLVTGDTASFAGITLLRDNASFSDPANTPNLWFSGLSRENAYALGSHVVAERAGNARITAKVDLYVSMALKHIYEWLTYDFAQPEQEFNRVSPFMCGLTSEALTGYYDWEVEQGNNPDNTIPAALKSLADHLMVATVQDGPKTGLPMWIENVDATGYGAFRYEDREISSTGTNAAPALNLLIAPLYTWLYKHYNDTYYRDFGDKVFAGGVMINSAYLLGEITGKQFFQSYRWSFDHLIWRAQ